MNVIEFLTKPFRRKKPDAMQVRAFEAGNLSRLTNDWLASGNSADSELFGNVKTMRNRARQLERDNDYARKYLSLVQNNVLGANGIGVQMKIRERVKKPDGKWTERYDTLANGIIEDSFSEWSRPENCTIHKRYSLPEFEHLVLRSAARDGAVLVRYHYPQSSKFKFALEIIEIDQLDEDYNATHPDGTITKFGIRRMASGEVVGYWILGDHPGELFQLRGTGKFTNFVPARFIRHIFRTERAGQSTGFPWLVSSMVRLKNLGAFEDAAVVNARVSAAKMGFLVPDATASGGYGGATAPNGGKYMDVEPGSIEQLPNGYKFEKFDPAYPSAELAPFIKAELRGIASGLGVSYTALANDLEGVNYSSIRAGLLEEREEWKTVQQWFISQFMRPVFEEWLSTAAIAGALKNSEGGPTLPASKLTKWNQVEFKPRRWPWVDPLNDLQAAVLSVDKGFNSKRAIISEGGGDIEDVYSDIAADEDLAEEKGLDFSGDSGQQANAKPTQPKAPADPALTMQKD